MRSLVQFIRLIGIVLPALAASGCGNVAHPGTTGTSASGGDGGAGASSGDGGAGASGGDGGGAATGCRRTTDCNRELPNVECISYEDPCFNEGNNFFPPCFEGDCQDDALCFRCAPQTPGVCIPPCAADADCPTGSACDESKRCVPSLCRADEHCPVDFRCDLAANQCVRRACAADADCEGYCIGGVCRDALGTCAF
ncbi:hypothetical protein [Sorangium sp. So ce388]|uniref:hypothetical protein n=1 Tax=Sorangium sp. So ce388 TaxID=3133309 RepID=UPI003F5C6B09